MKAYERAYGDLNEAQRQAVDAIDGPVLVLAGPGTGKTQLLSARVANILQKTDTLPQNILCLTFTESGAANMRERLSRFIGKAAYDVTISTYHAFGGDIIHRYGQYFNESRTLTPIDNLTKHQILASLIEQLPYSNPLKQTRHHLGDLISTISELKRGVVTSKDLRALASANLAFVENGSAIAAKMLAGFTMPRKIEKAVPVFESVLAGLQSLAAPLKQSQHSLAALAIHELTSALENASSSGKTKPLTEWKNRWLVKNDQNDFIIAGQLENERIKALADILHAYQVALDERGLFDFDDMIIRVIAALQQNSELKFTLQEQYQYVLLDEFQDTNAAQLQLVELLTDNPVHEGRPNVMAVGDDDQAIYAFQGAEMSNMLDFYNLYRDTVVINLSYNYRSHAHILETSGAIANQISSRLHAKLQNITKTLQSANDNLPDPIIVRTEAVSDIAQAHWIATRIKALLDSGTAAHNIVILAPKHKHLEPLVPHLNSLGIPVAYERRENILEAPIIRQLITMSRLVVAIAENNQATANSLWPEVLSYDFLQLPVSVIWQMAWSRNNPQEHDHSKSWSELLLANSSTREIALLFLACAGQAALQPAEVILDYLIGTEAVTTNEPDTPQAHSRLRAFYTAASAQKPELFYEALSQLKVLRAKVSDYQIIQDHRLSLANLLEFVQMYHDAGQQMLHTSPYVQGSDAVQLMTVFKAKGLEFDHVFLPGCLDDVWGTGARGNTNKLTLPPNLQHIRPAGTTEDERLRLLFVAITRARQGLYLCSYRQTYAGKTTKRLKYFDEQEQVDGTFKTMILPIAYQSIVLDNSDPPALQLLETDWRLRHRSKELDTSLRTLLTDRLQTYRLSPTHVTSFTDLIYDGPEQFFFKTLLRFPRAPSIDSQYGDAIHETLAWVQTNLNEHQTLPATTKIVERFKIYLERKQFTNEQYQQQFERGRAMLSTYMEQRGQSFNIGDYAEYSFARENIRLDDNIALNGAIDRLLVDKNTKTLTILDYKTGKSFSRWSTDARLYKYRRQLYCYKLLVEHSVAFRGYTATHGRLEFVSPDAESKIQSLDLEFKLDELERTRGLIKAVWQHVHDLNFPDVSQYPINIQGIKAFEDDLLSGAI